MEKEKSKSGKLKQNVIFFIVFCVTAVFMYWTNKVSNTDNSTLVMFITISVLVNVFVVVVMFATGIGLELIQRFLNKFKYKSGNFVNTLHVMKSGVIRENFVKKDSETGTFRMVDKPYVTNPKLMFNYKGIPSYVHREGHPDPLDIWEEDLTGALSNSEMDIAMNSKGAFDVKAWLEKNKLLLLIGGVVVVGVSVASAYFGYQVFEMLRDGTYTQVSVACNNLPSAVESIANTPLGGQ